MIEKNIVLIGMPGVGKSSVGVVLAKRLGACFIDSDIIIQEKTGILLEDIIKNRGIEEFLKIEDEVNYEFNFTNTIIATGGSVCYCDRAMRKFKNESIVIYLKLSFDAIKKRLGDFSRRGVAMREGEDLQNLYKNRINLYEKYADITIDCEGKELITIIEEIEKVVLKKNL